MSRKRARPVEAASDEIEVASESSPKRVPSGSVVVSKEEFYAAQRLRRRYLGTLYLPDELIGHEIAQATLMEAVLKCVEHGDSNATLLFGARGSGKTAIVERVLSELERTHQGQYLPVRLNGLVQTTDVVALREMCRQFAVVDDIDGMIQLGSSFEDGLDFIFKTLDPRGEKEKDSRRRTLVFVLDEFDRFSEHPKQSLLYSLLDQMQTRMIPMVVIGLTCRYDAIDLLEKRVKSRFSHRQIPVFGPANVGVIQEILRARLTITAGLTKYPVSPAVAAHLNDQMMEVLMDPKVTQWLAARFLEIIDVRHYLSIALHVISRLTYEKPYLDVRYFYDADVLLSTDPCSEILKGVSILELYLIVAMKKLTEKNCPSYNFEMVFNEYRGYAHTEGGVVRYAKPVAMKAFEHLVAIQLIEPADSHVRSRSAKEYRLMRMLLEPPQVIEALQKYPRCPATLQKWALQWHATD